MELDFLLRCPSIPNITSPVDFISNIGWGAIKVLSTYDAFRKLDIDIENNSTRWKKFIESDMPEKEKFPQEWKKKNSLQKLCMLRAMRPDRDVRSDCFNKSYNKDSSKIFEEGSVRGCLN